MNFYYVQRAFAQYHYLVFDGGGAFWTLRIFILYYTASGWKKSYLVLNSRVNCHATENLVKLVVLVFLVRDSAFTPQLEAKEMEALAWM